MVARGHRSTANLLRAAQSRVVRNADLAGDRSATKGDSQRPNRRPLRTRRCSTPVLHPGRRLRTESANSPQRLSRLRAPRWDASRPATREAPALAGPGALARQEQMCSPATYRGNLRAPEASRRRATPTRSPTRCPFPAEARSRGPRAAPLEPSAPRAGTPSIPVPRGDPTRRRPHTSGWSQRGRG